MEGDTLVLPAGLNGGIVACVCSSTPPEAEWAVDGVAKGVATPLEKEQWACPYPARWMFRGEQGDGSVHAIRLRVRNASGQTESHFYYRLQRKNIQIPSEFRKFAPNRRYALRRTPHFYRFRRR